MVVIKTIVLERHYPMTVDQDNNEIKFKRTLNNI